MSPNRKTEKARKTPEKEFDRVSEVGSHDSEAIILDEVPQNLI